MKYIGIRGHRGSGKNTISYLIGQTIQYVLDGEQDDYKTAYCGWCDDMINDEQIIHECSLRSIYFESFGDTPKMFIEMLLGCPHSYLYDDYYKDNIVVNLRDFSTKDRETLPAETKLYTREELYNEMSKVPATITKNKYILMREFILYFGIDMMQRYLGLDIWVKALKSNQKFYGYIFDENNYKIYTDLKTPSEVTYIKNNDGVIIKIDRPDHKKKSMGLDKLSHDDRVDYNIIVDKSLHDMYNTIYDVSKSIIEKFKQ